MWPVTIQTRPSVGEVASRQTKSKVFCVPKLRPGVPKGSWKQRRTDWLLIIIWFWLWFRPLHPEDGGSMGLWNIGTLPQHYTASPTYSSLKTRKRKQYFCYFGILLQREDDFPNVSNVTYMPHAFHMEHLIWKWGINKTTKPILRTS